MRALLAALLLTGLATTYAQDVEWFEVGPHYLSEVYTTSDGCGQTLGLWDSGWESGFYVYLFSSFEHGFDVTILFDNTTGGAPVWGGYGGGEFVDPADGMKVLLTPSTSKLG